MRFVRTDMHHCNCKICPFFLMKKEQIPAILLVDVIS